MSCGLSRNGILSSGHLATDRRSLVTELGRRRPNLLRKDKRIVRIAPKIAWSAIHRRATWACTLCGAYDFTIDLRRRDEQVNSLGTHSSVDAVGVNIAEAPTF